MIYRTSRRDHDPALHSRMQAARIAVGSGFREGERKAVVRIERFGMEFALAANDAMGNVVAIAEDDCRPGFHGELLWRKSEIIDVHLHVRRANRQCRNGGESGGDKQRAATAPHAGAVPFGLIVHVCFLSLGWFSLWQAVNR